MVEQERGEAVGQREGGAWAGGGSVGGGGGRGPGGEAAGGEGMEPVDEGRTTSNNSCVKVLARRARGRAAPTAKYYFGDLPMWF